MASITLDLTGSNQNYYQPGRVFRIFKYEQRIDFETVVYADSLKVYRLSTATPTEMVLGEDYIIPDDANCDNDTSRAKLIDTSFDRQLISAIVIIQAPDAGVYDIEVSYQQLYPSQVRTAYFHSTEFNWTDDLAYEVVKTLEELKILSSKVSSVSTLTEGSGLLLELDPSYSNHNNHIEHEVHYVDVSGGRYMLHPKGGSFYRDSVTVYHPASGLTLVEGKDYAIVGMDEAKTKYTSSKVPVYNFILFMTIMTGYVEVTYHAYGGDPTLDNYTELLANINNIVRYLNEAKFVSNTSLGSTDAMGVVYERLDKLEAGMRRLNQERPYYGDMTSGKYTQMKIYTDQAGLHWYTIASLYTTGENTLPCICDTFTFRLQTSLSHIQFTCACAVDLSNTEGNRLNVSILSENYPKGFIPYKDYSNIDTIIRPQIRLVWANSETPSGAYLQLGFELKTIAEETIGIEDISGHESCWKLVEEISAATTPHDNNFLLPNEVTVWNSSLLTSLQESQLVPFKQGHLAWSGYHPMNEAPGWSYLQCNDHYLDPCTDITRITKLRVDIEELDGHCFAVDIPFTRADTLKGHAVFTHADEPAYINAEIVKDGTDITISLNFNVIATQNNTTNRIYIRDLIVY